MPSRSAILLLALAITATAAEDPYLEGEVIVTFRPGGGANRPETTLARHQLPLTRRFAHLPRQTTLVREKSLTTAALVARLKHDPDVATVEPNYLRHHCAVPPNDPQFPQMWGLHNTGQIVNFTAGTSGVDTNFLPAWRISRPPAGEIVVGVVDSGMDLTHPDLAPNLWTNPGEIPANGIDDDSNGYIDDVHGYDFGTNTPAVYDAGYHGTHVAGTIAAGRNLTGTIGVQYHAKLLPLRIANADNLLPSSAVLAAYNYALALKQRGVNLVALNASFGGYSYIASEFSAIQTLRDHGIILCAAAGNEAFDNNTTPLYPASYPLSNILSVASLTQNNTLAATSNYGSTTVDLAAPGENIRSTRPTHEVSGQSTLTIGPSGYASEELSHSATTSGITGSIHHCGLGNPGDFPPAVSGNIALIERGSITFAAKVTHAIAAGATAAIIYDNTADPLTTGFWTLGDGSWIPSLRVTQADGLAILSSLPATATLTNTRDLSLAYRFLGGTSMAAPHVSGAVALAALNFPAESMAQRISRITSHTTPVPALAGKTITGGRLNLLRMIDTDSDNLPDWWENDHFGNLSKTATGDEDSDGFDNRNEFLSATDPKNPSSHLAFSSIQPDPPQSGIRLTFPSVRDQLYQIERSTTLLPGSWQPLGSPVTGTGAPIQITDPGILPSTPRRFYRMTLVPD